MNLIDLFSSTTNYNSNIGQNGEMITVLLRYKEFTVIPYD